MLLYLHFSSHGCYLVCRFILMSFVKLHDTSWYKNFATSLSFRRLKLEAQLRIFRPYVTAERRRDTAAKQFIRCDGMTSRLLSSSSSSSLLLLLLSLLICHIWVVVIGIVVLCILAAQPVCIAAELHVTTTTVVVVPRGLSYNLLTLYITALCITFLCRGYRHRFPRPRCCLSFRAGGRALRTPGRELQVCLGASC